MNLTAWKWETEPGQGYSTLYKRLVPLRVRRHGGYLQWAFGRFAWGRIQSFGWRVLHRCQNRLADLNAVRLGYCNHNPFAAELDAGRYPGTYSHWRCLRKDSRPHVHRFNNYTWSEGEKTVYDPVDWQGGADGSAWSGPKWMRKRSMIQTCRQVRQIRKILGEKY
jgi:hypothetical protein